jgi:hypothetical protein
MPPTLQALVNRIAYLRTEEQKVDRDIATLQQQTLDALARKASTCRDDAVSDCAKYILSEIQQPAKAALAPVKKGTKPLGRRPHSGA